MAAAGLIDRRCPLRDRSRTQVRSMICSKQTMATLLRLASTALITGWLAGVAGAQAIVTETFKTITTVGAAENAYALGANTMYFHVAEAIQLSCPGAIYIDVSAANNNGKALYQ